MISTTEEVKKYLGAAGVVVIDVRTAEEFAGGNFAGAKNIPLSDLSSSKNLPQDKATPVVLYCRSGARASSALGTMKTLGYTKVINAGGLGDILQAKK